MAVTVTYSISPSTVGTTPPTQAQASGFRRLGVQVNFGADTDTTALVTHNWSFTTTQLANLQPLVSFYVEVSGTAAGLFSVQHNTSANAVTVSKGSTVAGSGTATVTLQLQYPWSGIE